MTRSAVEETRPANWLRLIARRDVSSRAVVEAHLARIAQVNPTINAMPTVLAKKRSTAPIGQTAPSQKASAAARCMACRSASRRTSISWVPPTTNAVPLLAQRDAVARSSGRRAHESGRRDSDRPHQHARHGPAAAYRQRVVRPHAQSVESRPNRRRFERRRSGGARNRHESDRPRQRHRRFAAQSRVLLRHRIVETVVRPHSTRVVHRTRQWSACRADDAGARTDGTHRCGFATRRWKSSPGPIRAIRIRIPRRSSGPAPNQPIRVALVTHPAGGTTAASIREGVRAAGARSKLRAIESKRSRHRCSKPQSKPGGVGCRGNSAR